MKAEGLYTNITALMGISHMWTPETKAEVCRMIEELAALARKSGPLPGCAEIEPKPQDGRRESNQIAELRQQVKDAHARIKGLEAKVGNHGNVIHDLWNGHERYRRLTKRNRDHHNSMAKAVFPRLAVLEGLVEKLSRDQPTRITDLAQQVQALEKRVVDVESTVSAHKVWMADLVRLDRETNTTHYTLPTPPQPADDAEKWSEVFDVASEWSRKLPPHHGGQITRNVIAKATELGLVTVIDPEDPDLHRIVFDAIDNHVALSDDVVCGITEQVLTALAGHLNGRTND